MSFTFNNSSCYLISLNHRADRRDAFKKNIESNGFESNEFKTIEAIENKDFGALGCAKSHVKALSYFLTNTENQYCCIFEDDFNFRQSKTISEGVINKIINDFNKWNVILLSGTFVTPMPTVSSTHNHAINKVFEANSTSGYIVNRKYTNTLISIFIDSIVLMEEYKNATPRKVISDRFAIDQSWKILQRKDEWYCSSPMLGEQIESYSDIEKEFCDYSKYSF